MTTKPNNAFILPFSTQHTGAKMAAEKIYIIDELIDQDHSPVYNPLLDTSTNIEDLIAIKEKKLVGKKASFNNQPNTDTREVLVTGLVLHFSEDMADSRLRSILGRTDMEYLYLYADTIIIDTKLSFPQTQLTIACRQLIIEENGQVDTTPEANPQPFAVGNGGDQRKAGNKGEDGGSITLLCKTIENKHSDSAPVFISKGAVGQNGEMGGLKAVTPDKNYPLSWSDIEKKVINNDYWPGTRDNWDWPDFSGIQKDKIYYAELNPVNFTWSADRAERYLKTSIGNNQLSNQDNGADAIASGNGGNGGNGGNFRYLDFETKGRKVAWDLGGGGEGKSIRIEGGKKAKDSAYYHIYLKAFHRDINYDWNKGDKDSFKPKVWVTNTLYAQDGAAAKGPDGVRGGDGREEKLAVSDYTWLHPTLLETMLDYAKTTFRDGERHKAEWILNQYSDPIKQLPVARKDDMQTAALVREAELYSNRLKQNLDFYGYPPGWIPRLSALSNLQVIRDSRRNLAQLIYFSNRLLQEDDANKLETQDLEWTITKLKSGLKAAQADISAAFTALPAVQNQLHAIEAQVNEQLLALRNLKKKILKEVEEKQQAQALFTGAFEIAAGICTLIPVGQPYLGQIGGGILKRIGAIDIDAENPLKEGLSFAKGLSDEVGSYVDKNKDKLAKSLTSGLNKEIEKGTKELNAFSDKVNATTAELAEAEKVLKDGFKDREIAILREKTRVLKSVGREPIGDVSQDYALIIENLEGLHQEIARSKDLAETDKQALQAKLSQLEKDKKPLADKLKARKKEKEDREKAVEKAGKTIKGFCDGIGGISSGIQAMMVEFDEDDPEVQAKFEKIKQSKYKQEFETIYEKINDINAVKLPLVEKLLRLEQQLSHGVQRINNNMVQWSVLNEQRITQIQYGLLPATRQYLKRLMQESWDLLMLECYYMTKSYQYRFLEKTDSLQHGLKEFITDIEKFRAGKDVKTLSEAEYTKLFDQALKSQFTKLAYNLLVKLQASSASPRAEKSVPVITEIDKNAAGDYLLEKLHSHKRVTFRLEDIASSKHGTDAWFHYKIIKIIFRRMKVESANANVSFAFGIRHSGDSYIRGVDKKLYFFTSRSSQKELYVNADSGADIDLQVQSWNASYNGSDLNSENHGISNDKDTVEDQQLLYKLLSEFDLKAEYDKNEKPYKDHYPGASSELTLMIYDNSRTSEFKIKELEFEVDYEVLR